MTYINRPQKRKDTRNVKEKSEIQQMAHRLVYSTPQWKKLRLSKLMTSPLCEQCGERLSEEVHHIIPLSTAKDEMDMIDKGLDYNNLRALCKLCHDEEHRRLRQK